MQGTAEKGRLDTLAKHGFSKEMVLLYEDIANTKDQQKERDLSDKETSLLLEREMLFMSMVKEADLTKARKWVNRFYGLCLYFFLMSFVVTELVKRGYISGVSVSNMELVIIYMGLATAAMYIVRAIYNWQISRVKREKEESEKRVTTKSGGPDI